MATDPRTIINDSQDAALNPSGDRSTVSASATVPTTQTVTIQYTNPPLYGAQDLQIINDPGGNTDGAIQFNASNRFGGDNNFRWDNKNRTLNVLGNIRLTGELQGKIYTSTARFKLYGGNSTNVLSTDGNGNVSWVDIGNVTYGNDDVAAYLANYTGNINSSNVSVSDTAYMYNISSTGTTLATNFQIIPTGTANLGPASNITITGGNIGQVLATDGSGNLSWVDVSSTTIVSDTAPNVTTEGTFWFNEIEGRTYIRYQDTWVDASPVLAMNPDFSASSITFFDSTVQTTAWTGIVDAGNVSGLSSVATSGLYGDLSGTPTIPTNLSDLTNDTGFITVSALTGYATETYVDTAIGELSIYDQSLNTTDSVIFDNVNPTNELRVGPLGADAPTLVSLVNENNGVAVDLNISAGTYSSVTGDMSLTASNIEVRTGNNFNIEAQNVVNIITDSQGAGYQWQFGDAGELILPGDGVTIDTEGMTDRGQLNITLPGLNSGEPQVFRFSDEGGAGELVFPDGTRQATAWTGNISYNDLTDTPTIPSLTGYATETYVNTAVSNLVAAAPGALDTLNELAAALGDDPNFATTINSSLSLKANSADLATVATTGNYTDLVNTPAIPSDISDLTDTTSLLFSGAYADLTGKPTIPSDISDLTDNSNLLGNTYTSGTGIDITTNVISVDSNVVLTSGSQNIETTGNITAANFIGNVSLTGNITGTSANIELVAGNFICTFDNTGVLTLPTMGGNEGAEIRFGLAETNTTLQNRVTVDVYQDRFRIFEGSGDAKGAYIDLSQASNGASTLLNNRVSGYVNAGTFVTMDNLKATISTSGNRSLQIATVTGSFSAFVNGSYAVFAGGTGGTGASVTVTTTPALAINWNFTGQGDTATYVINDTTNSRCYRVTMMIGGSYNNNMISIERLV